MRELRDQGLAPKGNMFICNSACSQGGAFDDPKTGKIDEQLMKDFEGLVGVDPLRAHGEPYKQFLDKWEKLDPNVYSGAGKRSLNVFAPYAYDIVYVLANTFESIMSSGVAPEQITGQQVLERVKEMEYEGTTGTITFDEKGDRNSVTYIVYNLHNGSYRSIGEFDLRKGHHAFAE